MELNEFMERENEAGKGSSRARQFLRALEEHPGKVLKMQEAAAESGISMSTLKHYLSPLKKKGVVITKKIDGIWYFTRVKQGQEGETNAVLSENQPGNTERTSEGIREDVGSLTREPKIEGIE